jgi:phosphate starvation-inducible protein PhoH
MRLFNKNSRRGIVNLFADFIVSKIDPKERSIIQITDCEVFMVVNGQTTSETELNIDELKNEFNETYKDILKSLGLEHFNVINIIKYGVDIPNIETGLINTNKKVFVEEDESFDEISINELILIPLVNLIPISPDEPFVLFPYKSNSKTLTFG